MPNLKKGLEAGRAAPDFTLLPALSEEPVHLSDYRGQWVVLLFFRGLVWQNCRRHWAQLRSESNTLTDQGAVILGVVGDSRQKMAGYLEKNPVPFPMLIDEDRQVMQQFEVYNRLSWDAYRLAHPSAFLIDPQGQVRYSFVASNQWDWPRTEMLVDELAKLRAAEEASLQG